MPGIRQSCPKNKKKVTSKQTNKKNKKEKSTNLPSKGPHCPTVARTVYPPARLDSVAWMLDTQASNKATEANISTDRKMLKYRGPVVVVVALMMNPTPARVAARAQKGPRIWNLSESQQKVMIVRKQRM